MILCPPFAKRGHGIEINASRSPPFQHFVIAWSLFPTALAHTENQGMDGQCSLCTSCSDRPGNGNFDRQPFRQGTIGNPRNFRAWNGPKSMVASGRASDPGYGLRGSQPSTTGREAAECRRIVLRVADLPAGADGPFLEAAEDGTSNTDREARCFPAGANSGSCVQRRFAGQKLPRKAVLRIGMAIKPTANDHDVSGGGAPSHAELHPWRSSVGCAGPQCCRRQRGSADHRVDAKGGPELDIRHGGNRSGRQSANSPDGFGFAHAGRNGSVWTYSFRRSSGEGGKGVSGFGATGALGGVSKRGDCTPPVHFPKQNRSGSLPKFSETFTGAIDLDSASAVSAQPGIASTVPQEAGGRDADLVVEKGALNNFGTMFALVKNEDWEALSPQQAIDCASTGTIPAAGVVSHRRRWRATEPSVIGREWRVWAPSVRRAPRTPARPSTCASSACCDERLIHHQRDAQRPGTIYDHAVDAGRESRPADVARLGTRAGRVVPELLVSPVCVRAAAAAKHARTRRT